MDRRRSNTWLWVIAVIVLLLIVGAGAYYLGAVNGGPAMMRPRMFVARHPFLDGIGFWLIVLLIALGVGAVVAALWPSSRRTETFEEWHQREHAMRPPPAPPAVPPSDTEATVTRPDEGGGG